MINLELFPSHSIMSIKFILEKFSSKNTNKNQMNYSHLVFMLTLLQSKVFLFILFYIKNINQEIKPKVDYFD